MHKDIRGYVLVGNHIKFHRLTMEKHLGRKLKHFEFIHHKDGNIENNTISNLEIISNSAHAILHRRKNYHKHFDLDWLREQLKTRTQRDIAKECEVSEAAIGNFIDRYINHPECRTWLEYYKIRSHNKLWEAVNKEEDKHDG